MMTKIKKWLIALFFGSAVLAAPLVIPNTSFEKLDNVQKISDKYEVNFGEGSRVKIGGSGVDFKPHAKLGRWDDEVEINVWLETDKKIKPKQDKEKLKWKEKNREVHFYTIDDDKFEFEIILNERPDSNITELKIDSKGLKFYYQPELTQEEIDEGAFRPGNVVGSYAVYHESKQGDYSKMGLKNYRAGKAFHIYRPKIIDSAGKEVWGELNITDNLLTVEIPQEFLDNAVYPVRHAAGLTFGYESVGATSANAEFGGSVFTAPSSGIVSSITVYLEGKYGSNFDFDANFGFYNDDAGDVGTHIAHGTSENIDGGFADWKTKNVSGSITQNNNYWLMMQTDDGSWVKMFADSGGTDQHAFTTSFVYDDWSDTSSMFYNNWKRSIYATYTAGGAAERRIIKIE